MGTWEGEEEVDTDRALLGLGAGVGGKHRGVSLSPHLCLVGGGFQSGGNRAGSGGKKGNPSGKNVMVEPHRHEGE